MKKVYKNQDLRLVIPTVEDLTDATVSIRAIKPDGATASYTPTIATAGYSAAIEFQPDQSGSWRFWLYAVWPDTKVTPSNPVELVVEDEGIM